MAHVPDFPKINRAKGDKDTPDIAPRGPVGPSRGKYPADGSGPPKAEVGKWGPSGSPYEITAQPEIITRPPPAKSPRFNSGENTTK